MASLKIKGLWPEPRRARYMWRCFVLEALGSCNRGEKSESESMTFVIADNRATFHSRMHICTSALPFCILLPNRGEHSCCGPRYDVWLATCSMDQKQDRGLERIALELTSTCAPGKVKDTPTPYPMIRVESLLASLGVC